MRAAYRPKMKEALAKLLSGFRHGTMPRLSEFKLIPEAPPVKPSNHLEHDYEVKWWRIA